MHYFDYKIDGTREYPREIEITCRSCVGHSTPVSNAVNTICYDNTVLGKIYPDYYIWINNENQLINRNNSFYQEKNICNDSGYTALVYTMLQGTVVDSNSGYFIPTEIEANFILPPGCSAYYNMYDISRNFLGKNKVSGHIPGCGEVNCCWSDYCASTYVIPNGLYVEFIPLPAWPAFCAAIDRTTTNGWRYTKGFTALTNGGGDNCSLPIYQNDDVDMYKYGVVGRTTGNKYHDCIYRVGETSAEGLDTYIKYTSCGDGVGFQNCGDNSCTVQEYLNGEYPLVISSDGKPQLSRYGSPDISRLCSDPSAWGCIRNYCTGTTYMSLGPYKTGIICFIKGPQGGSSGQVTNYAVNYFTGINICEHYMECVPIGYCNNQYVAQIGYSYRLSTMRKSSNVGRAANYPMIETNN